MSLFVNKAVGLKTTCPSFQVNIVAVYQQQL